MHVAFCKSITTIVYLGNVLYIFIAKLLVTTGYPYGNGTHSEIINLNNDLSICEDIADAPYPMYGGAGGLVNNKLLICGGKNKEHEHIDNCFVLGQNITFGMKYGRKYPSSFTYISDSLNHEKVSCRISNSNSDLTNTKTILDVDHISK